MSKSNTTKKFIVVDGLIGAGKTTLIKLLHQKFNKEGIKCVASYEPVDIWENTGALQKFYSNIKDNCYNFQTFAFVTRIKRIIEDLESNPDGEIFLLERSIFSDKYIFVEMLKKSGMFDQVDIDMYNTWWDMWEKIMPAKPDLFVLLDTSVDDSMERLKIRNRDVESSSVEPNYQIKLRKSHFDFYNKYLPEHNYKTFVVSSEDMSQNYLDNLDHPILEKIKKSVMKNI